MRAIIRRVPKPKHKPTSPAAIRRHFASIKPHFLNLRVIDFFDPLIFGDGSIEPIGPKAAVKQFARIVRLKENLSFRKATK